MYKPPPTHTPGREGGNKGEREKEGRERKCLAFDRTAKRFSRLLEFK